jgi:hypothetical protein
LHGNENGLLGLEFSKQPARRLRLEMKLNWVSKLIYPDHRSPLHAFEFIWNIEAEPAALARKYPHAATGWGYQGCDGRHESVGPVAAFAIRGLTRRGLFRDSSAVAILLLPGMFFIEFQ